MRAHSTCSSAKIVILPAQPVEYTLSDSGRQLLAVDHHAHSGGMGVDGDLEAAETKIGPRAAAHVTQLDWCARASSSKVLSLRRPRLFGEGKYEFPPFGLFGLAEPAVRLERQTFTDDESVELRLMLVSSCREARGV